MRYYLYLFVVMASLVHAKSVYVTQAGAGLANGTSVANAYSAAGFNTAANWGVDANDIGAGDTVYLSGTFTTRLAIQASGTSTSVRTIITDTAALPATIETGINGAAYDYIAVIGLTFTQPDTSTVYSCIALTTGAVGWLIQDNTFEDTYLGGVTGTASTMIVRKNTFDNLGVRDDGSGGGGSVVNISLAGNDNLIEYNTVTLGMDRVRVFGERNVVRNNYFGPTDSNLYTSSSPYPHHTDDFQTYGTTAASKLLYEKNYSKNNLDTPGGTNAHGFLSQLDSAASPNPKQIIGRFNVSWNTGGGIFGVRSSDQVHYYNNTQVRAQYGSVSSGQQSGLCFEAPTNGNAVADVADMRNNTLADSPKCLNSGSSRGWYGPYDLASYVTNWTHGTNHTYNYGATDATYPTLVAASPANLSKTDPLFTDKTNGDFTLTGSSPLRAAGSSIITAVGAGVSSTALTVSNSYPLFDGWTIADADYIKIGSGSYVQISSIDHATHIVTLAEARSWSGGDTVIVRGMEDIGAMPYGSAAAPAIVSGSISGTDATVTVSDSFNVRFVEILVDGLPVGTDYVAATNTYVVGSIPVGTVYTARAYAAWASTTPTVEIPIYTVQALTPAPTRQRSLLNGGL